VLIGDTPDDAVAAHAIGAGIILYDGGSHHLHALQALGFTVAHRLSEAVDMAVRLADEESLEAGV